MYSKLEEASFPLVSDRRYSDTKFTKAGTFNPSNIVKHASRHSFFVWKISDKVLEIHELTTSKQLQHNRFTYDFAIHQNNATSYVLPQIEFIEYRNDNGQNMIAFHVLASNWTLYQFKVLHPQQLNEYNQNLSVLHPLQEVRPSEMQLTPFLSSPLSLNRYTHFVMFDLFKILISSSNQLLIIDCNGDDAFMIHRKEVNKSIFSSLLPSSLTSTDSECEYRFMHYYKPVASRTIIGAIDNKSNFELYLLSNHKLIDSKVLHLSLNAHRFLFYGYRHEYGVCWFNVIVLYVDGGGAVIQCQYKQNEDTLMMQNEVLSINGLNDKPCIDAQIYNNVLWCVLLNELDDYDVYFCDIKHYSRNTVHAEKWKFHRMWKRSEYIDRILNSIQTEFSFDTFHQQLSREWMNNKNMEQYKQKLHELILNFWLNRLVDDPTLELNEQILEHQLKELDDNYGNNNNNNNYILSTPFQILNNDDDMHNNETMTRIMFESKLQALMMRIMDSKYPDGDRDIDYDEAYMKSVWSEYNQFFLNCLEKAKEFGGFMAINCIVNDSVIIIKENGLSVIRNMDYSEQIEVYFDRYRDESDELNDLSEPPMRLHKFIGFCHDSQSHDDHNDIYHWLVASTWFYYQNKHVFDALDEKDIISDRFATYFNTEFMSSHAHQIKHHTNKQLRQLYQRQNHDFIRDIIALFTTQIHVQSRNDNNNDILEEIWNETGLMSCIESSFASIVAARYSLLRSVFIAFLCLKHDADSMDELSDLLKGYFILSYLSSSIYEPKQYLGINNNNNTQFREELLSNLQSSFRCGLAVAHYLRYCEFKMCLTPHDLSYFESPLDFSIKLVNSIFNGNDLDLVYGVVEFMFIERQFEALHVILSFMHYISPLFKYLLARCYIEMDIVDKVSDAYCVKLINECGGYVHCPQRICDREKSLLGLILTEMSMRGRIHEDEEMNSRSVDIYHLAPRDCIEFPKGFMIKHQEKHKKERMVLSSSCTHEYEWSIVLSYYFEIIKLYKNIASKPQIVIEFAKGGIELINKEMMRSTSIMDSDHDMDETELVDKVRKYSGIATKRAYKLCKTFGNNLESILLSIYRSNFMLEIVFECLKMEQYSAAYQYLIKFDDLFCAKTGIKQYVSTCCKKKKMWPILCENWNESSIQFTEWSKYLLSFKKANNIWLKQLNYCSLVELIIYNFALQFNIEDSFCFDLLYTFSMKNKEYQYAAKYMFEYAIRIEQYVQNKTSSTQKLQYHCLCHVLSAMDLNNEKYILLDFKLNNASFHMNYIFNKHENIVRYEQIKKYYIFIQSKNCLLSRCGSASSKNKKSQEYIANYNVVETANELYKNGFYSQSLLLLDEFEQDCCPIFDEMIQTLLLFGGDDAAVVTVEDTGITWNTFEMLLLDYDDIGNHYKYSLHSLRTILLFSCSSSVNCFVVPSFIYNRIQTLNDEQMDVFIVPLIDLLLQFGKITQSLNIFYWMINKTQISITNNCYNYQNHSFWKCAQKLYAYCNTLALKQEGHKLITSLANWIARPQS